MWKWIMSKLKQVEVEVEEIPVTVRTATLTRAPEIEWIHPDGRTRIGAPPEFLSACMRWNETMLAIPVWRIQAQDRPHTRQ